MRQQQLDMFFAPKKPNLVEKIGPVITAEDFEFESSTESENETSSEFADESTPSSPKAELREEVIHTRHADLALAFRPVRTPDWHASDDDEAQDRVTDFSCEDIHFRLEVLEHRIQMGEDEVHEHPGMAVAVLRSEGVGEVSRKEQRMRENYGTLEERAIVPTFWAPRVYDREEDKLSQEESDELMAALGMCGVESFTSPMVTRRRSWHPHEPSRSPSVEVKPERVAEQKPKTVRKRERRPQADDSSDEFVVSDDEDEVKPRTVMETRSHRRVVEEEEEPKEKHRPITLRLSSKYFDTDDSGEETDLDTDYY